MKKIISLFLFSSLAVAQQAQAPQVTPQHRGDYFKAQSQVNLLEGELFIAQQRLAQAQDLITKDCLPDSLVFDQSGEPQCSGPKPPLIPPEAK